MLLSDSLEGVFAIVGRGSNSLFKNEGSSSVVVGMATFIPVIFGDNIAR